jgi:hypothetical protein
MPMSRHLALPVLLAALAGAATAATGTAAAADTRARVTWRAAIDGRDVATATSNAPLPLRPGRNATVTLAVDNHGTAPLDIRAVRLDGRVLGLSFFTFSSRIDLVVPPGTTRERVVELDLGELGEQATGLIPGTLSLVGQDRSVISQQEVATDVRGSVISPYGAFGMIVGAVTLVLALSLAWEIAGRRLPVNRWRRGVRFLAPGLGLGLSATFTLSATRVLTPSASVWVPLVLLCGAVAFVLGYLTPAPRDDEDADRWATGSEPAWHGEPRAELAGAEPLPAVDAPWRPAVLQIPDAGERPELPGVPGGDVTALEPAVRLSDPQHP